MDAPFYLALGDVILEAGESAGPYHVQGMRFPEPAEDGYGGHEPATREVDVKVTGADASTLSANIAALRREGVRDKLLRFKPTLAGQLLECRVRKASVVEEEYDPLRRSVAPHVAFLKLSIETDPYWLAPWSPERTAYLSSVPGYFIAQDPGGETDALVRMRMLPSATGSVHALGVYPNDDADMLAPYPLGVDTNADGISDRWGEIGLGTPTVLESSTYGGTWQFLSRTSTGAAEYIQMVSLPFPASAGDVICAQVDAYFSTTTAGVQYRMQIAQLDAADALLDWGTKIIGTADTAPRVYTHSVTCVASTAKVRLYIDAYLPNSGNVASLRCRDAKLAKTKFMPIDDYGTSADTSDANAYGGYKKALAASGTLASIGTAPFVDTDANSGRHLLIARLDSNATTASSVTVRGTSTVTGNAIAASTTVNEQAIACTSQNLIGYELGTVTLPAGQVSSIGVSSAGYGPEGVDTQNTTAASLTSIASWQFITQSFAHSGARHMGISLKVKNTATYAINVTVSLFLADVSHNKRGSAIVTSVRSVAAGYDGLVRFEWDIPLSGGVYCIFTEANDAYLRWYYSTASSYATYKMGVSGTPSDTDDLYFTSWSRTPLGFNTSNPIQAACSESSKTVGLDYVQRIPTDYACLVYRPGSTTTGHVFYDGDTDTPYIASAAGTGPAIYDKTEIRRPLRLKPGKTNYVVAGICQGDSAIGTGSYVYSTRARYLTATG